MGSDTQLVELRTSIVKGPPVDLTQRQTEGTLAFTEDAERCTSKESKVSVPLFGLKDTCTDFGLTLFGTSRPRRAPISA